MTVGVYSHGSRGLLRTCLVEVYFVLMFNFLTFFRVIATSQMQATYARKTFPCFDEPAMKAIFTVTMIHDRETVALSNGRDIGLSKKRGNAVLLNTPWKL